MWKCSTCKREFLKTNQSHSCVYYPIENHFKNKKEIAMLLFDALVKEIEEKIGPIKIESLPCCIHFVSHYTFGATWAQKTNIKIDFRLDRKVDDQRFLKEIKMSANRYLYYLEIKNKDEIDDRLIGWLRESYSLSS